MIKWTARNGIVWALWVKGMEFGKITTPFTIPSKRGCLLSGVTYYNLVTLVACSPLGP